MLVDKQAIDEASALMESFAERTGLTTQKTKQRYLWTDAFAVCNFFALADATGEERYARLALQLIDEVHHVLGHHRRDGQHRGWLSGLDESEGERHPTRGGLRIGKKLPERSPGEPYLEKLEWDRDGQYFHYLTKWMNALDRATHHTGQQRYNAWARELASVAHAAFVYGDTARGHRRMVWKMSTDLSRPLVPSMGQHDPLDGLLTCLELRYTESRMSSVASAPDLTAAVLDFASMVEPRALASDDPLGLGSLLVDTYRVARLRHEGAFADDTLLPALLTAAHEGLVHYSRRNEARSDGPHRLAFRELGLAIGLSALALVRREDLVQGQVSSSARTLNQIFAFRDPVAFAEAIRTFWLNDDHRHTMLWAEHRDINEVMLATALVPQGFLGRALRVPG